MKDFGRILPAIVLAAILTATGTVSARADSASDLRQAAIAEVDAAGGSAGLMRACGVEPYAWLRHVLTQLPLRPPGGDIEDLMPFNFAERAPHQNTS